MKPHLPSLDVLARHRVLVVGDAMRDRYMACGLPMREAAALANSAAGIVVSRFGTAAASHADLAADR
jgi:bifunctional ADP-heptose synthase (sugar kinase/adenylyltransferase)